MQRIGQKLKILIGAGALMPDMLVSNNLLSEH